MFVHIKKRYIFVLIMKVIPSGFRNTKVYTILINPMSNPAFSGNPEMQARQM